jgi:hypothetical protein
MADRRPTAPDHRNRGLMPALSIGALALVALAAVLFLGLGLGGVTFRYRREILLLQGAFAGIVTGGLIGYVAGWLNGRRR